MVVRFLITIGISATLLVSGRSLLAQHGGGGHAAAGSVHFGGVRGAAPVGRALTTNSGPIYTKPPLTTNSGPLYRRTTGWRNYGFNNFYGRGYRPYYHYRYDYHRYPFSYFLTPYYYPLIGYGTQPFYDDSYPYDSGDMGQYSAMPEQELADNQPPYEPGYPPPYAAPPAPYSYQPPPPDPQSSQTSPAPPVTIVLRDGQKFQVQSYAIMDQTFWDFSKQPARKIPLSSIDIPASTKATVDSGAEFPSIRTGS